MPTDTSASQEIRRVDSIEIRRISTDDLREALKHGLDDFWTRPSHYIFLVLIYPVLGIALSRMVFGYNMIPLLFPLAVGFAFVGPIAALGVYEISRRIERGETPTLADAFQVLRSPQIGPILRVGGALLALFTAWLVAAWAIYWITLGPEPPRTVGAFIMAVLTTGPGWAMIVVGNLVGLGFAVVALAVSVFSLPMLMDGEKSALVAVLASVRAVQRNPGPMAMWGVIVAVMLALGSLPVFAGLIFVFPILGHATWHLYRRTISR